MAARDFAAMLCAAALALVLMACAQAARAETPQRIPLVVGLTTIRSVAEAQGDYESIRSTSAVSTAGYSFGNRAEVPDGPGGKTREIKIVRRVPMADHLHARVMRNRFNEGDPEVFAGTTPGVSADIVIELRTSGRAVMTFLDVRRVFGLSTERALKGTVTRIGAALDFPIIVNGRRAVVRALHAKGSLADEVGGHELEFHVLDDPDNPLMLATTGPGFTTRITRIEYPQAAGSPASIESKLAANEAVDVYGIYFAFGSDLLRPESDRVLQEVADLLKKHGDWKLQVDGHSDNIGGDGANLDLSRRRAAAVKAALVQRYAIAAQRLNTGGFGEGRPKDRNDTIEGRAINRRVELKRL